MPTMKMTARSVESIKSPSRGQVDYWDADNPGLGLRVSAGGRRAWVLMYRHGGVKRRLTLGTYPALGLADAREKAGLAKHDVEFKGEDPAAGKKAARKAETIKELVEQFLEFMRRERRSADKYERLLNKDVVPRFGLRKANAVTRRDIIGMLDQIVARGSPISANRTFAVTRSMFNWGIGKDILQENPCDKVKVPAGENRRDKVLSDDEIRSMWNALDQETARNAALYKIRLLTAQRGREVLAMRWDQIAGDWWTIPAEVAKNGLSHRVPLTQAVLDILEGIRPEIKDGASEVQKAKAEWVFPNARRAGPREYTSKLHATVVNNSGVDFVPHDLRRTAASLMTGMGGSRLTVSKLLNHVETSITAVYDRHSYDQEKRHALDVWASRLEQILNPKKADDRGNVVLLKA